MLCVTGTDMKLLNETIVKGWPTETNFCLIVINIWVYRNEITNYNIIFKKM